MPHNLSFQSIPLFSHPGESILFSLTATVIDADTHEPASGVTLWFSTVIPLVTLSPDMGVTNDAGQLQTLIHYGDLPVLPMVIPITAATAQGGATFLFNIYNPDFGWVSLTNVTINQSTGAAPIDGQAIAKGIQARIIYPAGISPGSKVTLYWGNLALEKEYDGGATWVINIQTAFGNPAVVLANGQYWVWYRLEDPEGISVGNRPINVTVTGSPYSEPVLLAPTLPPELYNIINLAAAQAGVAVTVSGGQALLSGNPQRSLFLTKRRFDGTHLSTEMIVRSRPTNASLAWVVTVPPAFFLNFNGIYGDFYYTATINNVEYSSFITRTIIDTVPP